MRGKNYTIMLIPHTRARFTRFRVSAIFVAVLSVLALAAIVSTGLLPLYVHLNGEANQEIDELREQNRKLHANGLEMDNALTSLRDKVGFFENEATKFALMVGVEDLPSAQPAGGVREFPVLPEQRTVNTDRFRGDVATLQERAGVLIRSYSVLDKVYHDQSLLLASTPSIAPVRGMISYGFRFRKDPFTGRRAFHSGLDLVATLGTPVAVPADGIVIRARRETGYGNVIYISHGNGVTTRFGHLSAFNVRAGEKVRRGDIIGQVGNTGRSLGYHLHYEVLVQGTKVNPMHYILDDEHVS
jgi:murein DD-endopeptidase MepM/ murein hydrolase activator NlpD